MFSYKEIHNRPHLLHQFPLIHWIRKVKNIFIAAFDKMIDNCKSFLI